MKKFLTVTTFCLAIASVATTQANSKFNETGYKPNPSESNKCTLPSIECSSEIGDGCIDGNSDQLFRFNDGPCTDKLQRVIQ